MYILVLGNNIQVGLGLKVRYNEHSSEMARNNLHMSFTHPNFLREGTNRYLFDLFLSYPFKYQFCTNIKFVQYNTIYK